MSTPDIGIISGTPNTGLENSNKLVRAVDPILHYFKTDMSPFASMILTKGLSIGERDNSRLPKITGKQLLKKGYSNPKIEYFEDQVLNDTFSTTAPVTAAATTLTVSTTDDDYFKAGDMLLLTNANNQTERVRISTVATSTLTITNEDGTTRTAGITMTTSDKFYILEAPRAEDSTAWAIRTTKSANMYNYLESVSETWGLTDIKRATSHSTGDPKLEEKMKAYARFKEKLEKMILFGNRAIINSTTNPVYQNGGLFYHIEQYSDVEIRDFSGLSATRAEINSFISAVCKNGTPDKIMLCDSKWLDAINSLGYQFVQAPSFRLGEIGMNIQKISGPFGSVQLVYEPMFDRFKPYNGSAVIIDMNDIEWCHLAAKGVNLDIAEYPIIQADGATSEKGEWKGMVGVKLNTLKHMGWAKNLP